MKIPVIRKVFRYFKYEGALIFNSTSKNLPGIDFNPRYRIKPRKLIEILSATDRAESIDHGYIKDEKWNLYFNNIDMSEASALVEFHHFKNTPPYGFIEESDYIEYVMQTFDEAYQKRLETIYQDSINLGVNPIAENGELTISIISEDVKELQFYKEREVPSKKFLINL
jgi:hypothetical protein